MRFILSTLTALVLVSGAFLAPGLEAADEPGVTAVKPAAAADKPASPEKTAAPDETKPGEEAALQPAESVKAEPEPGKKEEKKPGNAGEHPLLTSVAKGLLGAPFGGGRNSFLHALLGLPDMTAGQIAPPGCGRAYFSGEIVKSAAPEHRGTKIDATYFEGKAGFAYSLSEFVEMHGSLSAAVFGGEASVIWTGSQMVPAERDETFRVSRANLGCMLDLVPLPKPFTGIWTSIDIKIPVTDQDLADSGRPGVAFSFMTTADLKPVPVFVHANVGWFLSDGQQCFEPIVTPYGEMRMPVDRCAFWGLSAVWAFTDFCSVGLQYSGNTNAFWEMNALRSDVHALTLGFRIRYRTYYAELSAGAGLSNSSADFGARLEIGVIIDPTLLAYVTKARK